MNTKIWFASDLHLGHKNITKPVGWRPAGFEKYFLDAWFNVVGKDDIICILGDICFGTQAYYFDLMSKLPGEKVLVLGNHDKNKHSWYAKWGFRVTPFTETLILKHDYGNILLSHVPASEAVLVSRGDNRFQWLAQKHAKEMDNSSCILNIHGHTHGLAKEAHNTFDASLEVINYAPIELEQIIELKVRK